MNSQPSASSRQSEGFDLLAEPVRRWIWRKGWTTLRDIQERSIPKLIKGDGDVIIAASTASGKTEAAFLPLISMVHGTGEVRGFDLVYIGPLKALINDQFNRLDDLCESLKIPVYPWHGDIGQGVKARARKNPGGVLLITPESLEAMFVLRGPDISRMFAGTHAIVIDELHALLDSERGVHLRSLLTRLEMAVGHRIRRVGLSATLGDMNLVNAYLRPEEPDKVEQLVSRSEGQDLRVQLRAYVKQHPEEQPGTGDVTTENRFDTATSAVGSHLFDNLRGVNNLIFAGSRQSVETYSDLLRQMSEDRKVPNEFFPHHANLSRYHRDHVEQRLKQGSLPVTVICTSTLELGIDIGDVDCVGQIGAPWSVAALRQRLGRSGRRAGQPAVLRMYTVIPENSGDSNPVDMMHLELVQSVAMIGLLIEGWCEPPRPKALHLSTLTHQVLSLIAERGGLSANGLFVTLCKDGPFRSVSQSMFASLLRQLGDPEVNLIEQAPDGTLLAGCKGERLIDHYSFYAVFQTKQEFRVVHGSKTLGTIPMTSPLSIGLTLIFAGRRWRIEAVSDRDKVIEVVPDHTGKPPVFGGGFGHIHETVIERMRDVLNQDMIPRYLDSEAASALVSARRAYRRFDFETMPVCMIDKNHYLLATWAGTIGTASLAIVLASMGYTVKTHVGFLEVSVSNMDTLDLMSDLDEISKGRLDLRSLVMSNARALQIEKFHRFLNDDLLLADALSSRLDLNAVPFIADKLSSGQISSVST